MAEKSSYEIDHRVVWPDGTVHWIQGRGTVTLDDDGEVTGTIGCCADISGRKLAELEHHGEPSKRSGRPASNACSASGSSSWPG